MITDPKLISGRPVPIGTIIAYAGTNPSQWESSYWLLCDGAALDSSSNKYSNLFQIIGTLYGGAGVMFNKPDLRGMFLRGDAAGTSRDPDIAQRYRQGDDKKTPIPTNQELVGSVQDDAVGPHTHPTNATCFGNSDWHLSGGGSQQVIGATIQNNDGKETRPQNVYVHFLIYAGAPVA